jgi:hypothetical protein
MSLDLTFLIPEYEFGSNLSLAFTMIQCERRNALFEMVLEVEEREGQQAPANLRTHLAHRPDGSFTWGDTPTTPYGDRLQYVYAGTLGGLAQHAGVLDNHPNRAAWAYLAALPPDWPVVLYWN